MKKSENHRLTLTFYFSDPGYDEKVNLGLYKFYGYVLLKLKRVLILVKPSLRYFSSKCSIFWDTVCACLFV